MTKVYNHTLHVTNLIKFFFFFLSNKLLHSCYIRNDLEQFSHSKIVTMQLFRIMYR